eukprot:jgi/Bigna1/86148/estExt_fgenesh1_pg.C_80182
MDGLRELTTGFSPKARSRSLTIATRLLFVFHSIRRFEEMGASLHYTAASSQRGLGKLALASSECSLATLVNSNKRRTCHSFRRLGHYRGIRGGGGQRQQTCSSHSLGRSMPIPMHKVATVSEMQALDAGATEKYGIPSILLMEVVGRPCAINEFYKTKLNRSCSLAIVVVLKCYPEWKMVERYEVGLGSKVLVFAGPGNNGGDGFVVARHANAAGADVQVVLLAKPESYKADAKINYESVKRLGIPILDIFSTEAKDANKAVNKMLEWADVSVDAIFGVGLTRPVSGMYGDIVEAINRWREGGGGHVFSLDIPSGHDAALYNQPLNNISVFTPFPELIVQLHMGSRNLAICFILATRCELNVEISRPPCIANRDPAGHKGSFGQALFIAGSRNYYGAPKLASMGFLRAGGGYSRLACPESLVPVISSTAGTVVFIPLPETKRGAIAKEAVEIILDSTEKQNVVVIGPGLSLDQDTQQMIAQILPKLSQKGLPVVVDGDALTVISKIDPTLLIAGGSGERILTPHIGELARLLDRSIKEVKADLVASGREAAKKYRAIVVVKGAHTLVVSPEGHVSINPTGNSGMGTAGSGDVLTGCISAMLCAGLSPYQATVTGVYLHGMAGDAAASKLGQDGMTADDILNAVPEGMRWIRDPTLIPRRLWIQYIGPEII